MPSKSATKSQARALKYAAARHRRNVRKLERAGLIDKSDIKNKGKVRRAILKYQDVIAGKATVLKTTNAKTGREIRGKLNIRGRGNTVVVPRHKGEKLKITKENKIEGTRQQYGQTVKREVGKFDFAKPPKPGDKSYYTIPTRRRGLGKLKRHTFASFDEMLFYLEKYEIDFEDIEDYIEVEYFKAGSKKQKSVQETLNKDRAKAAKRLKRKRSKK